ncbi:MAG: LysR family transcriptional regulator [Desulfohalobiaceae bacterium]|nr:LysR family transcriptional regulator [Desulfohalobiaceae bacterium]
MNLNQLKIFYVVAKHSSFSSAAEALFITQPAVTKAIQRMQEHHGIKFIDIVGKSLVLTDAGRSLYTIAEKIFSLENQAKETLRDYQHQKAGNISLESSESFGSYYLPEIIVGFKKQYPDIELSKIILPTEMVAENASHLYIDVGFISYRVDNQKLKCQKIIEDNLVVITAPEHRLAREQSLEPAALRGESVIMHEKGSAPRIAFDDFLHRHNIEVRFTLELSSNRAIKEAVKHDLGIALMSQGVVRDEVREGKLSSIRLTDPDMKREYYMVYHKDKYISKSLEHFFQTVYFWAKEYTSALE